MLWQDSLLAYKYVHDKADVVRCLSTSLCYSSAGASENAAIIEMIAGARSPEVAARLGRQHQRLQPAAVRPDWDHAKLHVMLAALRAKVTVFARFLVWSTAALVWSTAAAPEKKGTDFRAVRHSS